jgi:hypothetical protein
VVFIVPTKMVYQDRFPDRRSVADWRHDALLQLLADRHRSRRPSAATGRLRAASAVLRHDTTGPRGAMRRLAPLPNSCRARRNGEVCDSPRAPQVAAAAGRNASSGGHWMTGCSAPSSRSGITSSCRRDPVCATGSNGRSVLAMAARRAPRCDASRGFWCAACQDFQPDLIHFTVASGSLAAG